MHQSKLIQVLKTLSKKELKNFGDYLNAPLFHGRPGIKSSIALFNTIRGYAPQYIAQKVKKETVFAVLYPGQSFRNGKLEKQMSALLNWLQSFIVYTHSYTQQQNLPELLILEQFYRQHQLPLMADQCIRKYRKTLEKTSNKDVAFYYDTFRLEKQISDHQTHFPDLKEKLRLPAAHIALDQYYLLEKLELACLLLSYHRFISPVNLEKSFDLIEQLSPLLEQNYFEVPLIRVYFRAYQLLRSEESKAESIYLSFEKELTHYYEQIPKKQLKALNALIRNYCILQYHLGNDAYLERVFALYQEHLEKGYLYSNGKIFPATMANIVVFGARLQQFKWVFNFLTSHRHKITGTNQPELVYSFNLANYYFYTAEYEKVWDHLKQTHDASYYRLWARRLEIKVYYEQKHVLLPAKMDAFKIYIYRLDLKFVPQKQKQGNRHFIDVLKQICLPRTFHNDKRINKLIQKIDELQFISDKEWLLEKLEQLR